MKKILAVLMVLFLVASCVMAGVVAAENPEGKGKHGHGPRSLEDGLTEIEDFRGKGAQAEGIRLLPDQSPEELGIIQLTNVK